MRPFLNAAIAMIVIACCAGVVRASDVVEEETYVDSAGIVEECGEGDGLSPCRDAEDETYQHAEDPNYIKLKSTQSLEQSSAQIRDESSQELEKTIQQIEDDERD